MVTIPGASQFVNSARLANTQGISAQAPTVLGSSASATSLLDAGRSLNSNNGIGLSARARQLTNQLLSTTAAEGNALFSLAVGETSTIDALRTQILALRSKIPASLQARAVPEFAEDQENDADDTLLAQDSGAVSASENGQEIDTEA